MRSSSYTSQHHLYWESCPGTFSRLRHPRSHCGLRGLRLGCFHLPTDVELWVDMARLCIGNSSLQLSVPVQHGMVGIHVPIGRLCGEHDGTGSRIGLDVFQSLRNSWLIPVRSFDHQLILFFLKVLSAAVLLLWALVASRTAVGAWRGNLFFAPCLQNLILKENGEETNAAQHQA